MPPTPNGYGTFTRGKRKTVISRLPDGDVPPYRAVFLVTNAAFGAGILNFPQAYMNAGGVGSAISVQAVSMVVLTSKQTYPCITILRNFEKYLYSYLKP